MTDRSALPARSLRLGAPKPRTEDEADTTRIPAGDFSAWLADALRSMITREGTDVACGDCVGCCSSSYFIHLEPDDVDARARIPETLLFQAPGMPEWHSLMGFDSKGTCPMLRKRLCTIYEHRPRTCRIYDCRIFAAAGILAGEDDKLVINQRIALWEFGYPTGRDRDEHRSVTRAAEFTSSHPRVFPGGRIPTNPSQLALLALKVHELFLEGGAAETMSERALARAIVDASRSFDDKIRSAGVHS